MTKLICIVAVTFFVFFSFFQTDVAAEVSRKSAVPSNSFSLAATIGGYLFANSEHLESKPVYGVKLGYDIIGNSIADSLGLEATFNYLTTSSSKTSDRVTGYLIRIDAIYPFSPRDKLIPFVAVGAGGIFLRNSLSSESPLLNYGAGLKYFIKDYLALRVDARQLFIYNNAHTHNNFELTTGISYFFGKERKQKPDSLPTTKL